MEVAIICLGACVQYQTNNVELTRDTLKTYYGILLIFLHLTADFLTKEEANRHCDPTNHKAGKLERSLYACGLMCQHVPFDGSDKREPITVADINRKLSDVRLPDSLMM